MDHFIITNNDLIYGAAAGSTGEYEVFYEDCSHIDILRRAKRLVLEGRILRVSPFTGNLPPHEMPFRTLLLTEGPGSVDFQSLFAINSALSIAEEAQSLHVRGVWKKEDLADFRKADVALFECWITNVCLPLARKLNDEVLNDIRKQRK